MNNILSMLSRAHWPQSPKTSMAPPTRTTLQELLEVLQEVLAGDGIPEELAPQIICRIINGLIAPQSRIALVQLYADAP